MCIRDSFRARYWVLIHLRNAGFNQEELSKVYRVIIRPVHDYLCVVYHSMMSDKQDEEVERLQAHALRYIYGWRVPYARMRDLAGVGTLRQRRIQMVDDFAARCVDSARFGHWFPRKLGVRSSSRAAAGIEKYKESFARCDRLKNSSLYYMRRRLNGKAGKTFGSRNSKYRD